MKELVLLRHAKSDWSQSGSQDIDRKLNERGQEDAPLIGRFLEKADLLPDLAYLSPARRVQDTWSGMGTSWKYSIPSEILNHLYLAAPQVIYSVITQCSSSIDRLLVLGHNPGMEETVSLLCGLEVNIKMSTAALAVLSIESPSWGLIQPGQMTLRGLFYPRALKKLC